MLNQTSPKELQKLCSSWSDSKATFFSFSQVICYNSIQKFVWTTQVFGFRQKANTVGDGITSIVPNIILTLYRPA